MKLRPERLRPLAIARLERRGAPSGNARLKVDLLLETALRGGAGGLPRPFFEQPMALKTA